MSIAKTGLTFLAALVLHVPAQAQQATPPKKPSLTIIDANGKEVKVATYRFVEGTRRLGWLAPKKEQPKKEEPKKNDTTGQPPRQTSVAEGPEALAFREDNSTDYVEGVLTLIPLDNIRAIEFDNDKKVMTVRVAGGAKTEDDIVLTGTTRFARVNKLSIEAEVDKGEMGVASLKYQGGIPRGIKAVHFSDPKPIEKPKAGTTANLTLATRPKTTAKVTELKTLFRTESGEKLFNVLTFKQTLKIDLGKIKKLVAADDQGSDWQVTLKDGETETYVLLKSAMLDGKPAQLQGLVGRVPAGYRLFPLHTVAELTFDE